VKLQLHRRADHSQLAQQVPQDHQAQQVNLVKTVLQVTMVHQAPEAVLDQQVQLVLMVIQAQMVLQVKQASQAETSHLFQEKQDQPEMLEAQVRRDPLDPPAPMVNQEDQAHVDQQDPMDHQAQMVHQAKTVKQEVLVPLERRVSAPSTALWTVVFSSKMELVVKQLVSMHDRTIANLPDHPLQIWTFFIVIIMISS